VLSSDVTVCAVPSALFHETLVPFATVVVVGKDIPVIFIVVASGFPEGGVFASESDFEHEFKLRVITTIASAENRIFLGCIKIILKMINGLLIGNQQN
jgi:hypothetical protein